MVSTKTGSAAAVSSRHDQTQPQGNLGSLLTHYEHAQRTNDASAQHQMQSSTAPLTIDIPPGFHGVGVNEEDRDRALTIGSEFDQIFAHVGKDGRGMSIGGLLTPLGDAMSEGTSTTAFSGSTSSNNSGGVQVAVPVAAAQSHLPQLPEHDSSFSTMSMDTTPVTSNFNTTMTARAIPVGSRGRGESHGSAAMFMHGKQPISHTPPSHSGTSYENSHFGKRFRAGSISGRLRSMSDLEDNGVISREQKAILKDLIIAGDSSVQGAIDKYESGDTSVLEEMIKSGSLLARSSDVDLFGDLDLDFLNVGGDDADMMFGEMEGIGGNEHCHMGGVSRDSLEPIQFSRMYRGRGDSIDDINLHRMRANSLALPGFLLDGANPNDAFGQWLDQHVTVSQRQNSSECDALMGGNGNPLTSKPRVGQGRTKKDKSDPSSPTKKKERKPYTRKKDSSRKNDDDNDNNDEPKEVRQSGLGRPRSMSDPNLTVRLDDNGLLDVKGPEGWIGAYSPTSREMRIHKFLAKRNHRVWVKKVKYDVRKNFADSRLRVKGRFVKKEDEMLMRELMSLS